MANKNANVNSEQYEKFLIEEGEKIDSYINNYYSRFKIPKPVPPTDKEISFWNIAGLESSIFVLSGLGAALLSALRTGGLFFLMEVLLVNKYGLSPILGSLAGTVALITSLLAFEGTLIGIGLVKGRESGKIKISIASLVIAMLTVGLASIFSSFVIVEISPISKLYMDIVLALVTGIASSITTYLSFENVGFIRNDVNVKREEIKNLFSDDYKSWEESAIASYNATRKNITNKIINSDYSTASLAEISQQKKKSKTQLAYDFVSEYYSANHTLPVNQSIADNAGVSLGSAYGGLCDFILDNKEQLILKKLVAEEQVQKIIVKRGGEQVSELSSDQKITQFIQQKGLFPTSEQLKEMDIPLENTVLFIVQNQDSIRENKWLSEEIIQEAMERYNKN